MDDNLAFATASQLAELVRTKRVGCLELLDYFAARVERLNPRINAIIAERIDAARATARQRDAATARSAADELGPLHGVPMSIKESFDVPGLPTTWGLPEFRANVATTSATVVERLEAAGAIVFAKTNVPANLADWQTFNAIYGVTNNPWDLDRAPGGSSGGSAAALAAGLTPLEVGSDIGGSIRGPAHYCGVYGHKPTLGLVPRDGHALPGAYGHDDMVVVGPLARSAEDLRLALGIIAGPDAIDGQAWSLRLPAPTRRRLSDFRVGVLLTSPAADVDASVQGEIDRLANWLQTQGARVERGDIGIDHNLMHEAYIMLLRSATSRRIAPEVWERLSIERQRGGDRSDYAAWQARGNTLSHVEWLKWNNLRHQMRREWERLFQRFDLLLCPAAATPAIRHNHQGERWERMIEVNGKDQPSTTQMFWAAMAAMLYLPATVAPIGRVDQKLPVGVQIIGPQYADLTCIAFASLLERGYRGFEPPPAFV